MPAELAEHDHAGAVFLQPVGPRPARLEAGLVGEAVQGVRDLEQLAERAAGIEVVVHGVEEPLAMLGELGEQGQSAGLEILPPRRRLERDRTTRRSARRTARTPGRRSGGPARSRPAGRVRSRSGGDSGWTAAAPGGYPAGASSSRSLISTIVSGSDLEIFRPLLGQQAVVQPVRGERLAAEALRLHQLVLVVGEDQVEAAAVDVEVPAEELHAHRRALDVPPRPPRPPGALPRRLARLGALPQREVARMMLQRRGLDPGAGQQLLRVAVAELAVLGRLADVEVDVAARLVREPPGDQRAVDRR